MSERLLGLLALYIDAKRVGKIVENVSAIVSLGSVFLLSFYLFASTLAEHGW